MVNTDAPAQDAEDSVMFPIRVGDKLRAARTKSGMDLSDIATRTRIPQRHLAAIEAGDYAALPGVTYCTGFVKAFARVVGEDEVALARELRIELGLDSIDGRMDHTDYDAAHPTRIPSKTLAWTGIAIIALGFSAFGVWRSEFFASDPLAKSDVPEMVVPANNSQPRPPASLPAAVPSGTVVLTAKEAVWFRVYDKNDKVLYEGEKKAGESYTVPDDALDPMIRTGRADQIRVTVGGREVAQLGAAETTVKNVGISSVALAARTTQAAPGVVPAAARP
jgi:cytoskeleton protein RodZ